MPKLTKYLSITMLTLGLAYCNTCIPVFAEEATSSTAISEEMPDYTPDEYPLEDGMGTVIVDCNVPWDLHETLFANFTNIDTREVYKARMFEANTYVTSLNLPAGIYKICGGLINNIGSNPRYDIIESNVEVKPYRCSRVHLTIVDYKAPDDSNPQDHDPRFHKVEKSEETTFYEKLSNKLSDVLTPSKDKAQKIEEQMKSTQKIVNNQYQNEQNVSADAPSTDSDASDNKTKKEKKGGIINIAISAICALTAYILFSKHLKKKEDSE